MRLATSLDGESLIKLFDGEIQAFVESEIISDTPAYECYADLDELSSHTQIDSVMLESLACTADPPSRISFSGDLVYEVNFHYVGETAGGASFSGEFAGYFDVNGMFLEKATVDTSSFYQ